MIIQIFQNLQPQNAPNKQFYDKSENTYNNIKAKIIPRNDPEILNRKRSKYENGVVKVFLY